MILQGEAKETLETIEDNSMDAVVTDPPYGLGKEPNPVEIMKSWAEKGYHEVKGSGFMGKEWDSFVPQPVLWKEVYRVLKPGGHILVACGTRTQDWMGMSLRFAGFEIRDIVSWVYGSGFPKNLNVGKEIDKLKGNEREVIGKKNGARSTRNTDIDSKSFIAKNQYDNGTLDITKGNTPYEGYGTALKPAVEFFTLARKPISEKNIAENVLRWGTGSINIDKCRIEYDKDEHVLKYDGYRSEKYKSQYKEGSSYTHGTQVNINTKGRHPANLIHDGSDEVLNLFPITGKGNGGKVYNYSGREYHNKDTSLFNGDKPQAPSNFNDSGSASRFFYCAKVSKKERNEGLDKKYNKNDESSYVKNNHPTVKPLALMRYLCRLITPPEGTILDPFIGSGTTAVAAHQEGFNCVGIEMNSEYCEIAMNRLSHYQKNTKENQSNTLCNFFD